MIDLDAAIDYAKQNPDAKPAEIASTFGMSAGGGEWVRNFVDENTAPAYRPAKRRYVPGRTMLGTTAAREQALRRRMEEQADGFAASLPRTEKQLR